MRLGRGTKGVKAKAPRSLPVPSNSSSLLPKTGAWPCYIDVFLNAQIWEETMGRKSGPRFSPIPNTVYTDKHHHTSPPGCPGPVLGLFQG